MVNYLGAQFFHRFYLSSHTRIQLSSRTASVLHSLTNRVAVTLYYDRQGRFLSGHCRAAEAIPRAESENFLSNRGLRARSGRGRKGEGKIRVEFDARTKTWSSWMPATNISKLPTATGSLNTPPTGMSKEQETGVQRGRVSRRGGADLGAAGAGKRQAAQGVFPARSRRAVADRFRPIRLSEIRLRFAGKLR